MDGLKFNPELIHKVVELTVKTSKANKMSLAEVEDPELKPLMQQASVFQKAMKQAAREEGSKFNDLLAKMGPLMALAFLSGAEMAALAYEKSINEMTDSVNSN